MRIEPCMLDKLENRIMEVIESLTEKLDAFYADVIELHSVIEYIHELKKHLNVSSTGKIPLELDNRELKFVISCLEQVACEEGDFWTQKSEEVLEYLQDKLEEYDKRMN